MADVQRYRPSEAEVVDDPTSPGSTLQLFADGLGQGSAPFALVVTDPPNHTRPRHRHHGDVTYVYLQGEHHVEGEATYRAGDVRFVRAGHAYGPETTGAEGGTWWVISMASPVPVDVGPDEPTADEVAPIEPRTEVQRFDAPHDWEAIDRAVTDDGAAVVNGLVAPELVEKVNADVDHHLRVTPGAGGPASGSPMYDLFLGHRTVRLHGLAARFPSAPDIIGHPDIVAWVDRMLAPVAEAPLLNAGELIQIGPGEPAQFPHRDTDSWPQLPIGGQPVMVNAMVALTPFDAENGATTLALGSHRWDRNRPLGPDDSVQATMDPGDVLVFRGDVLHGGGANRTEHEHRRGLSLSYCAGWLRPVENSFLNVPIHVARDLPARVQDLLGYRAHDASGGGGGILGLYDNGDPRGALA